MLSSRPGQQPQEQMLVCTCSRGELVCQASAKHRSRLSPLGQSRRLLLPWQQEGFLPRCREQGFQFCRRSTEKQKCNR